MKKSWKIMLINIIFISAILVACQPKEQSIENTDAIENTDETVEAIAVEEEPEPVEEEPKEIYVCALTGLEVEEEEDISHRPIAVMIDNESSARPQSGITEADIVYEMPVEGNITRYMAIYHHLSSEKIGPVRSARPYFIDKAMEFGAIYVHCGGSPQALEDIKTLKVDSFDDLKGTPVFWRSTDRKMPHNLYTNTKFIREVASSRKIDNITAPEYFKFYQDFVVPDGGSGGNVVINYGKNYKVSYVYNSDEKVYYRQINGDNMKDKENKKNITTTNIIIEKINLKVLDSAGRLKISNIGEGRGYLLTGGKLLEIKWSKSSRSGKTVYKTLKGEEISINKGTTWIQIVPEYVKIEFGE